MLVQAIFLSLKKEVFLPLFDRVSFCILSFFLPLLVMVQASQEQRFAAILVEFALQMTALLDQINKVNYSTIKQLKITPFQDSFQQFRLRAGLARGPVVAGVVSYIWFHESTLDVIIFHFETNFNIISFSTVQSFPSHQVGGSKPQYDIWGNTVNVASRYFNLFF